MELPADKYLLQDYRDDMRVVEAPQYVDSQNPLVPVKSVGIGLPRPNSKQKVRWTQLHVNNAATTYQIATASSTAGIYFWGFICSNNAATAFNMSIWDAASGVAPALAINTSANDQSANFAIPSLPATAGTNVTMFLPIPVKTVSGIRATAGGAGQDCYVTIYWVEEIV